MLSCMIDAMEVWYVATDEIPEAVLQTDYDKGDININMEGEMVTLLEDIDPTYYKNFVYIYGRKKIHVCRIQEGYIRHPRGITNLLEKNPQDPRRNGIP